jgi:hypothetical protein
MSATAARPTDPLPPLTTHRRPGVRDRKVTSQARPPGSRAGNANEPLAETVKTLVARGCEGIVAARDAVKGEAVRQAIRAEHPGAQVSFHSLDMSQPDAVVAFAQQVQALGIRRFGRPQGVVEVVRA